MDEVAIDTVGVSLAADLVVPEQARGVVLFAPGSGSSRQSPRNRQVARELNDHRFATLLADLLTGEEEKQDSLTGAHRFDIGLLAGRMIGLVDWAHRDRSTTGLPVGLFGASTGAAAALVAAAQRPAQVRAVVSRGGRPDLAEDSLGQVQAPTLLIVGGEDHQVIELNRAAAEAMAAPYELHIVPGATHLFEEPGALEQVATRAADWFASHLTSGSR